jgi:catechol 2,3-dioxygenase-like lactoylglutathione lyase family enzyme
MLCRRHAHLPPQLRVLVVGDLAAARDLYGDGLGLPVLRHGKRGLLLGAGAPPVPLLALCPAAALELDGSRRTIRALLAAQGGSWVQLATSDLDATLARLRAYGGATLEPVAERADGSRAGAALDPWDNTLRVVERSARMIPPGLSCPRR